MFLLLIQPILPTLSTGLWGPADPFINADFNGGWWLWWASSEFWSGTDWTQQVAYPTGAVSLARVIPNPTDMFLLGMTGPPTALKWNLAQLFHVLCTLAAGVALARAAGASRWASATAMCLVAGSPVMLHEVAGGRPSNLIVWPGLLSLVFLVKNKPRASGLMAALQAVLYLWHGVALILIGWVLVRDWSVAKKAILWGGAAIFPYLVWLFWGNAGMPSQAPPDGYTALPLAGIFGMDGVPERFRLHALLFPLAFLAIKADRRWLYAGLLGVFVAVGPWPTWDLGSSFGASPLAWLYWLVEPMERMHHPVRVTLIGLPVLAVALALGLDALPKGRFLALALVCWVGLKPGDMQRATTYDQEPVVPFATAKVPGDGPVVDLLGMHHRTALSYQTIHRRSIAEPLLFRRGNEPVHRNLTALVDGEVVPSDTWLILRQMGFEYVLVFDRQPSGRGEAVRIQVEAALGRPERPGVYSLLGLAVVPD